MGFRGSLVRIQSSRPLHTLSLVRGSDDWLQASSGELRSPLLGTNPVVPLREIASLVVGSGRLRPISSRCGRGDESELLEHQKPVEHQIERDVLAIAEVEYLNVVQPDGAAGWRDVAHRAVKNAVVTPRECALLNHELIDD